jgi:NAD(P)-dependent dehydrogenase (short-subunit alcohol dehydrogenase family)
MNKKNIIVIGAGGRIGSVISEHLIKTGHKVLLSDLNFVEINRIKKKNFLFKDNIFLYKANLCKEKNINNLIKIAKIKLGTVDIALNCLYPKNKNWGKDFFSLKESNLKNNLYNNIGPAILFCQKVAKCFIENNKRGNIILFSSILGSNSPKFHHYIDTEIKSAIEYSAAKSAIISITKYLSKYLKQYKIKVNCISPGGIADNQPLKFRNRYKKDCNSKGLLNPEDLISTIDYLISEKSDYVNGQNIIVDDGWSL